VGLRLQTLGTGIDDALHISVVGAGRFGGSGSGSRLFYFGCSGSGSSSSSSSSSSKKVLKNM